ncbi:MAG: class I SAM-dependent methyltransferase [Pseudomonadota bacterium]
MPLTKPIRPHNADLFAEACIAYRAGDRSPFVLVEPDGTRHAYSLGARFRPPSRLNRVEQALVSHARGRILDVGTATGNLLPALARRGEVTGLDISPDLAAMARARGYPVIAADIHDFTPAPRFDTVTLFGNGLGMGGTPEGTGRLLAALRRQVAGTGQILASMRNFTAAAWRSIRLTPRWRGRDGPSFDWLIFSLDFLAARCEAASMTLTVITKTWKHTLVRIAPR